MADAAPASNAPLPPDTAPTAAPPRRSPWRIARTIAICLLIGAIMNIAVAWSLAAWLPQRGWHVVRIADPSSLKEYEPSWWVNMRVYSTIGASRHQWTSSVPGAFSFSAYGEAIEHAWEDQVALHDAPEYRILWWGNAHGAFTCPSLPPDGCEHAAGWPVLTGWYTIDIMPGGGRVAVKGGILIAAPMATAIFTPVHQVRALPLRPIWRGVIANSLVFAAFAWCLGAVALIGRHVVRQARGRCTTCAYSRAGLPAEALCPECGAR